MATRKKIPMKSLKISKRSWKRNWFMSNRPFSNPNRVSTLVFLWPMMSWTPARTWIVLRFPPLFLLFPRLFLMIPASSMASTATTTVWSFSIASAWKMPTWWSLPNPAQEKVTPSIWKFCAQWCWEPMLSSLTRKMSMCTFVKQSRDPSSRFPSAPPTISILSIFRRWTKMKIRKISCVTRLPDYWDSCTSCSVQSHRKKIRSWIVPFERPIASVTSHPKPIWTLWAKNLSRQCQTCTKCCAAWMAENRWPSGWKNILMESFPAFSTNTPTLPLTASWSSSISAIWKKICDRSPCMSSLISSGMKCVPISKNGWS